MAHLTDAQAQEIIDNNDIYKREVGGTFDCYHLTAKLDGITYQYIEKDTNELSATADKATVEAHFKSKLQEMEHEGTALGKTDTTV